MTSSALEQDGWYAVGGSLGLAPGALMPATLFGSEMVVWRDSEGGVHAWDNQCAHRGMRLSFGFVEGDRLACRYHGWRYATDGRCAYVPAHPSLEPPETFCVPAHTSAERYGLIWTTTGSPPEDQPHFRALEPFGVTIQFCRSLAIDADASAVAETVRGVLFPPFGVPALSGDVPPRPAAMTADPAGGYSCTWRSPTADVAVSYISNEIAPGIVSVEAVFGGGTETVIVAVQPVAPGRTQLHLLAAAPVAGDDVPALRDHYATWARRLRWFLENDGAETTSWRAIGARNGQDHR